MSATTATPTTTEHQQVSSTTGGGYKSFLKPSKFWHKNAKVTHHDPDEEKKVVHSETPLSTSPSSNHKTFTLTMPSIPMMKKSSHQQKETAALREAPKAEIYKLSTVNYSGVYLPPSPTQDSKRDHWLELDEDVFAFRLPGPERLTTYGNPDKEQQPIFYTPSVMINLNKLETASEDDVPSLMTDLSSGQATSVF